MILPGIRHVNSCVSLLAALVTLAFIGTGNPFSVSFVNCVKGRIDCSYDMPEITPSEAWLSNWKNGNAC